jgi:hypothetical protein
MVKKKARRISDAPSNKTFGNCLLVIHCSQNNPAENRAAARFVVVARGQQEIYQHVIHNCLWTAWGQFLTVSFIA